MEDRLIELQALQKALQEGTGLLTNNIRAVGVIFLWIYWKTPLFLCSFFSTKVYDKMQTELIKARESLTKILTSKDVKATVCFTSCTLIASFWIFFSLYMLINWVHCNSFCSYWTWLSGMRSIDLYWHFLMKTLQMRKWVTG